MSKIKEGIKNRLSLLKGELQKDASELIEDSLSNYGDGQEGALNYEATDVNNLSNDLDESLFRANAEIDKKWTDKGAKKLANKLLEEERLKFNTKVGTARLGYDEGIETPLPLLDEYQARVNNKIKEFNGYGDSIDKLNNQFGESTHLTSALINQLQFIGVLHIVGHGITETVNLEFFKQKTVDASILARQETSFDILDPMSSYSEFKMAEVYGHTAKRSLEAQQSANWWKMGASVGGAIILGALTYFVPVMAGYTAPTIGTLLAGAGIGATVGGLFGDYKGKEITTQAEAENIKEQAEAQAEIKFLNQVYTMAKSYVQVYRKYDIQLRQERTRLGSPSSTHSLGDLGYSLMSEIDIETKLAEGIGRYDSGLYHEQVSFTRAKGLDVSELQGINRVGQMISQDITLPELNYGNKVAKLLYGETASGKKTTDILDAIAETIRKMISHKTNINIAEVNKLVLLPAMIFGKDSAYGKIDQMGGGMLNNLNEMFNPTNAGESLYLIDALKPKDFIEFEQMKGQGIFGSLDNFNKLINYTKDNSKDYMEFYEKTNQLSHNQLPAGAIEKLFDYANGKSIEVTRQRYSKKGDAYTQDDNGEYVGINDSKGATTYEKYNNENASYLAIAKGEGSSKDLQLQIKREAEKNTSGSERLQNTLDNMHISIGKSWEKTISGMEVRQMQMFSNISSKSILYDMVCDAIATGTKQLENWLIKQGYKTDPNKMRKFLTNKGINMDNEFNAVYKRKIGESEEAYVERILELLSNQGNNNQNDKGTKKSLLRLEYNNFKGGASLNTNTKNDFAKIDNKITNKDDEPIINIPLAENKEPIINIPLAENKEHIINIPLGKNNTNKVENAAIANNDKLKEIGELVKVVSQSIGSLNRTGKIDKSNIILSMRGNSNKFYQVRATTT